MPEATDVLRREHRNILVIVHMAEEILHRRVTDPEIGMREMPEMLNYFLRYADHLHHAKEEQVLFPAIVRQAPDSFGLLDTLLEEHQQVRVTLAAMERAVSSGRDELYFETLRVYVAMVQPHITRENDLLLTLADGLFSDEEQAKLAERLAVVQDECMPTAELASWETWRETVAGCFGHTQK